MRTSFIGFLGLLNVSYAFDFPIFYSHPHWNDFRNFMKTHNKHYDSSELTMRYKTFIDNVEFIKSNTNQSHSVGVNKYADMNQVNLKITSIRDVIQMRTQMDFIRP